NWKNGWRLDKKMHRIGDIKNELLSFANLYLAYKKVFKATKNYTACEFTFNLEKELILLQKDLKYSRYVPGDYHYFTICDPKKREISVASFKDRVVHHALVNILEPIYEKRFISDSYATRKNKGTHRAIAKAQKFLKQNYWYLKMDVSKYFGSINHLILCNIIGRTIKDPFIINLCNTIIAKGGDGTTGLPIGNLTSQFFANVYLDVFDHFIKDCLKIKGYVRYMDDFCIFENNKNYLKGLLKVITVFLNKNLKLKLKKTATLINSSLHGLPFLGVRIFPNMVRYKKENFNRSYKKLKTREWEYKNGIIDYKIYESSMQSLTSHLVFYGNSLMKNHII
ncbi:MAG: RNA-directed DNA polymerase (Reverse transcriptase), partial [Actinobacteria bacterium]|nr:RNA-directed DNA polymerase (Reverse transcriptase) [Actinomycetota bacterium]